MIEREIGQTLYVESSDGPSEVLQPKSLSRVQFSSLLMTWMMEEEICLLHLQMT